MKKTLKIIISTLLLGVFAYLFWQAQQKTQERKEKEKALQEIPDFVFGQFSKSNLKKPSEPPLTPPCKGGEFKSK